jgi:hypothetical protein
LPVDVRTSADETLDKVHAILRCGDMERGVPHMIDYVHGSTARKQAFDCLRVTRAHGTMQALIDLFLGCRTTETHNVKVTGTLRQGAARCRISNGTVRPLAATCPSRPTC